MRKEVRETSGKKKRKKEQRQDGYVNMLNKYGTSQDNSTAYRYHYKGGVDDMILTSQYEEDGLFAKIIDMPAEEAVKHGFDLGLNNNEIESYVMDVLDYLDWDEKAATAIKWSRLYGGALIVMLIDDGRGIDEPLDWKNIRSIDELRVYERAVVQPDYKNLYQYNPLNSLQKRTSKFGMPEYYEVYSVYGMFRVHESRCLVLRNGILPEKTTMENYRFWGVPEYIRIREKLRETVTSHSYGVKLLERSVQAIYSMKDLAKLLSTEEGEDQVIKRLQVIDTARGILNSIAIDSEGENYDFKNMTLTGVKDIINTTCNMLSAVTNIPQTLLFGRSPAGENATGYSDLENYYNYVERIQKLMLRGNLKTLIDIVMQSGMFTGDVPKKPNWKLSFSPLWSMSETEQANIEQTRAQTSLLKAQATQIYVDMQALDPSEVRAGLARDEAFSVEELLDDMGEEELLNFVDDSVEVDNPSAAAVIVLKDGKILCASRLDNAEICGPGGKIEAGETAEIAAIREAKEEFQIIVKNLIPFGMTKQTAEQYMRTALFFTDQFDGIPAGDDVEMSSAQWRSAEELYQMRLFPPFEESLHLLEAVLTGGEING